MGKGAPGGFNDGRQMIQSAPQKVLPTGMPIMERPGPPEQVVPHRLQLPQSAASLFNRQDTPVTPYRLEIPPMPAGLSAFLRRG